jgi:dTDP-4-amino-4,6-dideoxygalactose transaminase
MIRMNDFLAEPEELRRAELAAIQRVFDSGTFILGNEVQDFEQAWAKFCGTSSCIGVANGMEAIQLGLLAIDVGPGDEVITTPMTAMATVLAIIHAGATPVLADINLTTALLDMDSARRCLSERTKAVLLVHLYGQLRDIEHWTKFCRDANVQLVEDCAQAHGAAHDGRHAGTFGAWGAFSFYPTKNLGAKGDAGALITSAEQIAGRVKLLRNYGTRSRYEHTEPGLNSRLDECQAAILRVRLAWLQRLNTRRQEIANRYFDEIRNERVQLLAQPIAPDNHVYHLFVLQCTERDRLADFLKRAGIETLIHYPIPAHRQKCCQHLRHDPQGLSNAESHAVQCLSIPCHPQLPEADVSGVIAAVNQFK